MYNVKSLLFQELKAICVHQNFSFQLDLDKEKQSTIDLFENHDSEEVSSPCINKKYRELRSGELDVRTEYS